MERDDLHIRLAAALLAEWGDAPDPETQDLWALAAGTYTNTVVDIMKSELDMRDDFACRVIGFPEPTYPNVWLKNGPVELSPEQNAWVASLNYDRQLGPKPSLAGGQMGGIYSGNTLRPKPFIVGDYVLNKVHNSKGPFAQVILVTSNTIRVRWEDGSEGWWDMDDFVLWSPKVGGRVHQRAYPHMTGTVVSNQSTDSEIKWDESGLRTLWPNTMLAPHPRRQSNPRWNERTEVYLAGEQT